jgi:hypothetical protein
MLCSLKTFHLPQGAFNPVVNYLLSKSLLCVERNCLPFICRDKGEVPVFTIIASEKTWNWLGYVDPVLSSKVCTAPAV